MIQQSKIRITTGVLALTVFTVDACSRLPFCCHGCLLLEQLLMSCRTAKSSNTHTDFVFRDDRVWHATLCNVVLEFADGKHGFCVCVKINFPTKVTVKSTAMRSFLPSFGDKSEPIFAQRLSGKL